MPSKPKKQTTEAKPVKIKPFWMVHVTGGGGANVRHATQPEAEREAVRLCRLGNQEVFVLKVQSRFTSIVTIERVSVKS